MRMQHMRITMNFFLHSQQKNEYNKRKKVFNLKSANLNEGNKMQFDGSALFTAFLLNRSSLSQKCVLLRTNELMRMPNSACAYITNANAACYHEIGNCRYSFCGAPTVNMANICEAFLFCSGFASIAVAMAMAPIYGLQSSKHRKLAIKLNKK